MNRNSENRFSINPEVQIQRSRFDRSSEHKTTFNAGELIPIYIDEILPGDTVTMDMAQIVRMSTPLFPTMDNAYLDTYFFFVPNRLVWDHWKEFCGENTESYWTQETIYEIPQIKIMGLEDEGIGFRKGSIGDYMGIPTYIPNISVNALPFRAYGLIWNEWFRDENLQQPAQIPTGDAIIEARGNEDTHPDYVISTKYGTSKPLKVNKFHDYFTSALPEPQKGPDVLLPLGDRAPVITGETHAGAIGEFGYTPLTWSNTTDDTPLTTQEEGLIGGSGSDTFTTDGSWDQFKRTIMPNNLWTDLQTATAATINELRQAFAIQKLFEKDARGGTRYTEILKSHFGVTSPDARLQRPEYLGGNRTPINIDQVIQTSETGEVSPQGNTAAYSLTGYKSSMFTKSFVEHGYIIGLACVRTNHTYQQGIERMWSRKRRFDFYYPALANIGEQAILNKEIYAQGTEEDEEAFGYQEAWAEYRYKPSRVSGEMRSNYGQSLDAWHYADYYESLPYLSADWMFETKENINRTLATTDTVADQFIADFAFKAVFTRPMPLYSIPGLIDHH